MTSKTKKILVVAVISAVFSVSALSFFIYKINSQGILLEEQIKALSENTTKESAYLRLQRLVMETESERVLLASSFFRQEGDSITFLSEVETLASTLGLSLKTESLDKVVDKESGKEYVKISFVYSGQKDTVYKFSKLLEYVPYHSMIDSLSLRKDSGNNWEGKLSISITLNSI